MVVIDFIVNQILSQSQVLIGLIAAIGLIASRKKASEVLSGTMKTIVGLVVLISGAGVIVSSLEPFNALLKHALGFQGVVAVNEAVVALALEHWGSQAALAMAIGFALNLIIARFTRFKFIMLTGQAMLYYAVLFVAVFASVGKFDGPLLVILGGVFSGVAFSVMPAIAQPVMRKITGGDQIAYGHNTTVGVMVSAGAGKLFGRGSRSTEELKIPAQLSFFRDTTVMTSIVMVIFYVIAVIAAGPDYTSEYSGATNFIVYGVLQGILFGAGVAIILMGVRMLLGELVPAFQGISKRLVPNAVPALDCPVVYPYAPTAVLIGFLMSVLGSIAGSAALIAVSAPVVILPSVIPAFFSGAAAGVFANATGGRRGAFIGGFINGLLIIVGPALLLPHTGILATTGTTFPDTDFVAWGMIAAGISYLSNSLGTVWAIVVSVIGIAAILFAGYRLMPKAPGAGDKARSEVAPGDGAIPAEGTPQQTSESTSASPDSSK